MQKGEVFWFKKPQKHIDDDDQPPKKDGEDHLIFWTKGPSMSNLTHSPIPSSLIITSPMNWYSPHFEANPVVPIGLKIQWRMSWRPLNWTIVDQGVSPMGWGWYFVHAHLWRRFVQDRDKRSCWTDHLSFIEGRWGKYHFTLATSIQVIFHKHFCNR